MEEREYIERKLRQPRLTQYMTDSVGDTDVGR
jgi:hypothetical protein